MMLSQKMMVLNKRVMMMTIEQFTVAASDSLKEA